MVNECYIPLKYIEGVAEECYRQGLTEKQASFVMEQALEKRADNIFSRGLDRLKSSIEGDEIEDNSATLKYHADRQVADRDAYQKHLEEAYFNNTHYSDGTPRKKPLMSEEEVQATALRRAATSSLAPGTIGASSKAIQDMNNIKKEMSSLHPADEAGKAELQAKYNEAKNRAVQAGKQIDQAHERFLGGYDMGLGSDPTSHYAKQRDAVFARSNKSHRQRAAAQAGRDTMKGIWNRLSFVNPGTWGWAPWSDAESVRKAKQSWENAGGWFQELHPDTFFVPSDAEHAANMERSRAYSRAHDARNRMYDETMAAARARARNTMQDLAWEGVTADGWTPNKAWREALMRQDAAMKARHQAGY